MPVFVASPPAARTHSVFIAGECPDGAVKTSAKIEVFDRDIMVASNAVPFLGRVVEEAEKVGKWRPCTVVGEEASEYEDAKHRSSHRITLLTDGPLGLWAIALQGLEGALVSMYVRTVNQHMIAREGSGWDLLRYGVGDRFGEHVDIVRGHPDRTLSQRRLSVVAFANGDFEGGELYFPRQGLTVVPEAGMVVLFPSGPTHPHEAFPVKSGAKYSLVTWFM